VKKITTNETTINNPKLQKFIIPLLLLSLALIFSFTMGTASAAVRSPSPVSDTIYVNNATGNDSWDGLSATWTSGTNGPKLSIKNATGTANQGGTVKIANGIYKGENNTGISIDKNMTIIGQSRTGTVIDAQGKDIFHIVISGINVTILNLTFKNGTSSIGGAISNRGNLTVNNCNFTGNRATQIGGAIINYGTLIAKNCTFNGNIARVNSGAIANSGTCIITGCTFANNTVTNGSGGAIFNFESNLTVNDSTFTGNHAADADLGVHGGAIYSNGNLDVTGCTFKDNTADYEGGALYNGGTCTVIGSTFTGNHANIGGVIYSSGNLTVNSSNFKDNHAIGEYPDGYGGSIYSSGNLTVNGSNFTGNIADYAGGAISVVDGDFNVTGSTFTRNVAEYGGAIYNWLLPIEVHFNRFYDNNATGVNTGDAIRTDGETNIANVKYNWWGSNNPDFGSLISGHSDYTPWLYMTLIADPTTIKNGEISLITASFNNLFNGTTRTDLNPATGHIPDGSPVNFQTDLGTIGCKSIDKVTTGGIATATLTATELAGIAHVNSTTDNQTLFVNVTITPKAGLYLTVTPSKANPVAGDTVVYTLKAGNKGPDAAKDVVMTYVVPEGLEFVGANVDVGTYTYDPATRTITWTIGDVPVGDPYMLLSLRIAQPGHHIINPVLSTSTYDPTINSNTESITVNALEKSNTVKAASKTIPLQKTGLPLVGILLAILAVFGGLVMPKRK